MKNINRAEQSRVDVLSISKNMLSKVCQLANKNKTSTTTCQNSRMTVDTLNDHYIANSIDSKYKLPSSKVTVEHKELVKHITEWRMNQVLDSLKMSTMGGWTKSLLGFSRSERLLLLSSCRTCSICRYQPL